MLESQFCPFSWLDIISIGSWPIWLMLGYSSLTISLITGHIWKYIYWYIKLSKHLKASQNSKSLNKISSKEQIQSNPIFLLRYLIFIGPLLGMLSSGINLYTVITIYDMSIFYKRSMLCWLLIKTSFPFCISLLTFCIGIVFLQCIPKLKLNKVETALI